MSGQSRSIQGGGTSGEEPATRDLWDLANQHLDKKKKKKAGVQQGSRTVDAAGVPSSPSGTEIILSLASLYIHNVFLFVGWYNNK